MALTRYLRLPTATKLRRIFGGDSLRRLDWMAYSGTFDCQVLDEVAATIVSDKGVNKGLAYYIASLYLQLGELERATDLLRLTGRATGEMKWFSMVLLHCHDVGLASPRLNNADKRCLHFLQEKYHTSILVDSACHPGLDSILQKKRDVVVIGNAPSEAVSRPGEFSISDDCVSFLFNSFHLNNRIDGDATVHVVTPSWRPEKRVRGSYLIMTGNSIFYRRSKVWRRFVEQPDYTGIYTVPRELWASLINDLQASPSAGLLVLSMLEKYVDLSAKTAFVGGFSDGVPVLNHSYDSEPLSASHNWEQEHQLRNRVLDNIRKKALSLQIVP